ncbi:max-binding protein MNT [Neosynchiropus ocellatus]
MNMSIETLLEAAKFLELQAQQQQKARDDELKEKMRVKQESHSDQNNNLKIHFNYVSKAEPSSDPAPVPPPLPPHSMPITVIPIPVVTPKSSGSPTLPVAMLSPPAAPTLVATQRDLHSPHEQTTAALPRSPQTTPDHLTSAVTANHKQPTHHTIIPQNNNNNNSSSSLQTPQHLFQHYPGTIVSSPQQQQPLLPLPQAPLQNGLSSQGSPPDAGRQLYLRKRPGGAGTREGHNKLEQNRRAHLKECFETLKKNIPNIDEKKTSNLSVLRSALRYIQTLKRKEKEYEHDMERLAREKIATQQRLAGLKNELSQWMDVIEIDRVLRQTVQPEEDQASTSTASEGEDIMDDDMEEEMSPREALPTPPQAAKPEPHKAAAPTRTTPTTTAATTSFVTQHIPIQHRAAQQYPPQTLVPPQPAPKPVGPPPFTTSNSPAPQTPTQTVVPTHAQVASVPTLHPSVIAHASVSHPSVIQAVNHVIQAPQNIAHLAPSTTTSTVQLAPTHQPIGHITVHSVAQLGQHLPALYPQSVAVTQPTVLSHITHTLNHTQVNGTGPSPPTAAIVGKQMMTHHPQLMGQTVLNPVTMVTMPSFPISTLKLA